MSESDARHDPEGLLRQYEGAANVITQPPRFTRQHVETLRASADKLEELCQLAGCGVCVADDLRDIAALVEAHLPSE